jgi:hypothetical protein
VYAWLWRRLPGPFAVRLAITAVAGFAVIALLFAVLFPWAEPRLPFNQVTIDTSRSPTPTG